VPAEQADVLNRGRLVSCVLTTQTRKDEPSYPTAPTNKQGEYGRMNQATLQPQLINKGNMVRI